MAEAERGVAPIPLRRDEYRVFTSYKYYSVDGELLAIHERLHHTSKVDDRGKPVKKFAWRQPDGTAGLDHLPNGMADLPLWLDNGLLDKPEARVFFCEGEAATQAVRDKGEVAVCSGGGVDGFPSPDALEVLRGREVVVWRDNDEPGYRYAEKLKMALRYIAKSVRVIVAPGDPKSDAVDYFAGGGSLDDLLGDIHPIVECISSDHWRVTVPTEVGRAMFDMDEIYSANRGELNCGLTVALLTPGTEPTPFSQRINLLSHSARASLETSLGKQFGKDIQWTVVVSKAYAKVIDAYRNTDRLEAFEYVPGREPIRFLVEEILPRNQVSVVFAPPAHSKSYWTRRLGLSVALGVPFCGLAVEKAPVIIVDYESPREDDEARLERLIAGMGYDPAILPDIPIRHWSGQGVPLSDQADALRRAVQKTGTELVIIDSIMFAAGGDLIKPEVAGRFFNSLSRIGVTTLLIGQTPAANSEEMYGGVGWRYGPHGRNWLLKKGSEGDKDDIDLALICKKHSNGPMPGPYSYVLHFEGKTGPVSLESQDFREVPEFARELSAFTPRIKHWLLNNPGLWTIVDIAKGIKEDTDETWRTLRDGRNTDFYLQQGTGVGEIDKWGLLASG